MISVAVSSDRFVGRREELAFLQREYRLALAGRTRIVCIEGEAGIGKSRLIREFLETVARSADALIGHCTEQIRRPYLALDTLLARLYRRSHQSLGEDGGGTADRAAFFERTAELLRRDSARTALVAVVEDLHWADDASVELLRYLAGSVRDAPLLLIVTLRPEEPCSGGRLARLRSALSRAGGAAVELGALRDNDVHRLIQEIARSRNTQLSAALVSQIESLADGVPLFAEEMARIALERGEVSLSSHVPFSVQAVLSERLGAFSEAQRATLVRAAVLGTTFDIDFLADVASLDVAHVVSTVEQAVRCTLVAAYADAPRRYSFRHTLIREALAEQLLPALRAPLHLRIAQALEAMPAGAERAAELAYHYSEAAIEERARHYHEAAAEAACRVYAYRDAIRFFAAALRWNYPAGPQRARVFERLGTLMYVEGVGEEPAEWFQRCRDEYDALGNLHGSAATLLLAADQQWVDARTGDALRGAAEAAANLERLGHSRLGTQAMLSVARYLITLGKSVQADAQLRHVYRLRERFDTALRASFHEVRAETDAALGRTQEALRHCRQAARLTAQSGSSELVAQIENNFALTAADLGELALAVEHHELALQEARRTSMLWRVAYCSLNYAQTLAWQGRLAEARERVVEALDCGVTTATFVTRAASVGIPLGLALRDDALVSSCADERALAYAQRSGETQRIASCGAAMAQLRAAQGDTAGAQGILSETLRAMPQAHRSWNLWIQIGRLGRDDDVAMARTLLACSTGRPRMVRAHQTLLIAQSLRSVEPARSRPIARAASRFFAAMGFALHAAYALEAAAEPASARAAFEELGAVGEAARLCGPPRTPPTTLTARQAQIAHLVAAGETNRGIAAHLHISEHTVEHHLSTLFARFSLKSRAQLAAFVRSDTPE